jgi:hypothetical protein
MRSASDTTMTSPGYCVDDCGADRGPDSRMDFRLRRESEKGTTGILYEVPTVGNLNGVW